LILVAQFGMNIETKMAEVKVSGIEGITADHVHHWHEQRVVPRLVGTIKRNEEQRWTLSVEVKTYPMDHPFALVKGRDKGILISTDLMGDIFASAGGPEPSATAASALKDLEMMLSQGNTTSHVNTNVTSIQTIS
jgi:homoserine dehydrogenase